MGLGLKEVTMSLEDANAFWDSLFKTNKKINEQVKDKNISVEYANDMKNYHNEQLLYLCLKGILSSQIISFGVAPLSKIILSQFDHKNPVISVFNTLKTSVPFLETVVPLCFFAVGIYATIKYAQRQSIRLDESKGFQSFKNELLNVMDINDKEVIRDEMSSNRLHQIYLIGNHVYNPDAEKIKNKINLILDSLKSTWSEEGLNFFNKATKLMKILVKKAYKDEFHEKIFKRVNELHKEDVFINKKYLNEKLTSNERHVDSDIEVALRNLNNESINQAAKTYASQNIQIMFARVVQDILKTNDTVLSINHKNLLIKFEDLHKATELKDKKGELRAPDVIEKISKMANDLLEGRSHLTPNSSLKDIITHINPEMIKNGKIKYGTFEKHIKEAKKSIVHKNDPNNKRDDFNLKIHHDTLINPDDLEKIISINMEKFEKKMKATKMSSLDTKHKIDNS
jgi:hypothetical protein